MIIPVRCFTCGKVRHRRDPGIPQRAAPTFPPRREEGKSPRAGKSGPRFHPFALAPRRPAPRAASHPPAASSRHSTAAADECTSHPRHAGDREQVGHLPGPTPGGLHRARRPRRAGSAQVLLPTHAHVPRRSHRETPQLQHPGAPGLSLGSGGGKEGGRGSIVVTSQRVVSIHCSSKF